MEDKLCFLCDDLVTDILSRLPPKYVAAFKCTSKRWLKTWKVSREFKCFASAIRPDQHVLLNGRCHWLTWTHHLLIFDVVQESCQVINLPHVSLQENYIRRGCLGVSEGQIHYACAYAHELKIWIVKNYDELPQWMPVLMCPPIFEFLEINFPDLTGFRCFKASYSYRTQQCEDQPSYTLKPLYIYNGVLFLSLLNQLIFYNTKSGETGHLGVAHFRFTDLVLLLYWPTIIPLKSLDGLLAQRYNLFPSMKRRRKSILLPKKAPIS